MSNKPRSSRIRTLGSDVKDDQRKWPDKKWLASENPEPVVHAGGKNRIHSVLIALPVLMLIIALVLYFNGERAQNNGEFVLNELSEHEVVFVSVSKVSGIGRTKHYLWVLDGDRKRGVRINAKQVPQLSALSAGDALQLQKAPKVAGSNVLWAYKLSHDNAVVLDAGLSEL